MVRPSREWRGWFGEGGRDGVPPLAGAAMGGVCPVSSGAQGAADGEIGSERGRPVGAAGSRRSEESWSVPALPNVLKRIGECYQKGRAPPSRRLAGPQRPSGGLAAG